MPSAFDGYLPRERDAVTDPTPTVEDRELVNEALARAVRTLPRHIASTPVSPLPADEATVVMDATPMLNAMIVEAEIAVATARLRERERCAGVVDGYTEWLPGKQVAAKIRSGD